MNSNLQLTLLLAPAGGLHRSMSSASGKERAARFPRVGPGQGTDWPRAQGHRDTGSAAPWPDTATATVFQHH